VRGAAACASGLGVSRVSEIAATWRVEEQGTLGSTVSDAQAAGGRRDFAAKKYGVKSQEIKNCTCLWHKAARY